MALPCRTVALQVLNRDTGALLDTLTPQGVQWTSDKGEPGALRFTLDTQDPKIKATPTLLDDRVLAVALDLDPTAPATLTPVAWYLGNPGRIAVVQPKHPRDTGDADLTHRGLLAMLDDWVVVHDGGTVRRLGEDTRYMGWMSAAYAVAANGFTTVTAAQAEPWATDSTARGLSPGGPFPQAFAGLPGFAALSWISAADPTVTQAANARHALVGSFTLTAPVYAVVTASADNYITLWLDGTLVYQQDEKGDASGWSDAQQPYRVYLEAGVHSVAIVAANKDGSSHNPVAAACAIHRVDVAGTPDALIYQTGENATASAGTVASSVTQWRARDAANITGVTAGWVFRTLLADARVSRAQGGLGVRSAGLVATSFSDTHDTGGAAWPEIGGDVGAVAMPIGTTGTEVVERLSAHGFVARMRPATTAERTAGAVWTVDAWADPGVDRSVTVALTGEANLRGYEVEATGLVATTLLVRHDEGWLLVGDTAAETAHGTRVVALESGLSLDPAAAEAAALANLPQLTRVVQAATATMIAGAPDGTGPVPYKDFDVTDVVAGLDRFRAPADVEVVSIAGSWSGDGDTTVVRFDVTLKEPT